MIVIPYRGGCPTISKVSVLGSPLNSDIACLKTNGIYVLSVIQCRCLACRFARLFVEKYCKRIIAMTHVCCI